MSWRRQTRTVRCTVEIPARRVESFMCRSAFGEDLRRRYPSLSVAAYAAVRFPDSVLDLRIEGDRVFACYRRRQFETDEAEWRLDKDEIPVGMVGRRPTGSLVDLSFAQKALDSWSRLMRSDDEIWFALC